MIADRKQVFVIEKLIVRCDECPRQAALYVGTGNLLGFALADLGWSGPLVDEDDELKHYCPEHS